MTTIELRYDVPVYVTVDLDTHEITRVIVDDEAVSLDNQTVLDADDDTNAAIALAEVGDWPEWGFGSS